MFFFSADYDVDVPGTPTFVTCDVTVSDGQLTDTALLVIGINNLNDNSPIFHNTSYTFSVKVNSSSGSFVGVVSAVDNDVGQFGETIFYFFFMKKPLDVVSLGQ